jgi:hypothetical protein
MPSSAGEIRWIAFPDRVDMHAVLTRRQAVDLQRDADAALHRLRGGAADIRPLRIMNDRGC